VNVGPGCVFEAVTDAGVFVCRDVSCLSFFISFQILMQLALRLTLKA